MVTGKFGRIAGATTNHTAYLIAFKVIGVK